MITNRGAFYAGTFAAPRSGPGFCCPVGPGPQQFINEGIAPVAHFIYAYALIGALTTCAYLLAGKGQLTRLGIAASFLIWPYVWVVIIRELATGA